MIVYRNSFALGQYAKLHTNGVTVLALVKNDVPPCKLLQKAYTLIPGVLVVHGGGSAIMPLFSVTFSGKQAYMTREQINRILVQAHAIRVLNDSLKSKTPPTKAESVPLLPAVCLSTRTRTPLTLAAAA